MTIQEKNTVDVPTQIFENFLDQLKKDDDISSSVIKNLRDAIMSEETPTKKSINYALLSDFEKYD